MLLTTIFSMAAVVAPAIAVPLAQQAQEISGIGWAVQNLTRMCEMSPTPSCTYDFKITQAIQSSTNPLANSSCHIMDVPQSPALPFDPVHNSFAAKPCISRPGDNGGWSMSWGYDATHDSAVMTLINQLVGWNAYFGWDHVAGRLYFEDVGPNPVFPIGTWN